MAIETQITSNSNFYHFKTMADFNAHKDEIANNSTIYVDESEMLSGNVTYTVLWENPNPTAEFPAQTITTKDMSGYDYILISFYISTGTNYALTTNIFKYNAGYYNHLSTTVSGKNTNNNNYSWNRTRTFQFTNSTSIELREVYECYRENTNTSYFYDSKNQMVPYQVVGIKFNDLSGVVVWENPDTNVAFPEQTITLSIDASKYKYYSIMYFTYKTDGSGVLLNTGKIPINKITMISYVNSYTVTDYGLCVGRQARVSENSIRFNKVYGINKGSGMIEFDNFNIIPYQVILYKDL